MSERRKPQLSMRLASKNGRKVKVELFDAALWGDKKNLRARKLDGKYRVRVNGKWFSPDDEGGRYQFMTIWGFRDKFFEALKNMIEEE